MFNLSERIREANTLLCKEAVPHEGRLGRVSQEPEDDTRFPFQRDRDRIIHSYSFLRLQAKTQVFAAGEMGDHVRTRLTHTMVVAQISRDLARMWRLNEDLAECIALAHDLGHPPFGHAGEEALDAWMKEHGGHFEHNEQSERIITVLEKHSSAYRGLNLNREVIEGLRKHVPIRHSLEAHVVNVADSIAYHAHDCDDGLNAGLFSLEELMANALIRKSADQSEERGTYIRGSLQHLMVHDLLAHSSLRLDDPQPIRFSEAMSRDIDELRRFLWNRMYMHPQVRTQAEEGQRIIRTLCRHYEEHPLPKILELAERTGSNAIDAIKDYVAGMTDTYAKQVVQTL